MAIPVIIDSDLANTVSQPQQNQCEGPYVNGTDIFVAVQKLAYVANITKIGVYLNAAGSPGWVEQDAANAPVLNGSFGITQHGTKLYFAYRDSTNALSTIQFDMATKLYSAVTQNSDTIAVNSPSIGVLSSGKQIIIVDIFPNTKLTTVTAGVFSAYATVSSELTGGLSTWNAHAGAVVVDAGDIAHLFHSIRPPGSGTACQIWYNAYASGSLGAPSDTTARGNTLGGFPGVNYGLYLALTDEVLIPFSFTFNVGDQFLLRGTPSASPSWTVQTLNTTDTGNAGVPGIAVKSDGSKLYFLWPYDNGILHQIQYLTQTNGVGAWVGPSIYYDESIDPPSPVPGTLGVDTGGSSMSATVLSGDTTFTAVIGLNNIDGPNPDFFPYSEIQFAPVLPIAPISVVCPIGGGIATVGVFYTATIVVTGGTPPYTFSMPAPITYLLWDVGFWDVNLWGV